jgi:hypothetical protein
MNTNSNPSPQALADLPALDRADAERMAEKIITDFVIPALLSDPWIKQPRKEMDRRETIGWWHALAEPRQRIADFLHERIHDRVAREDVARMIEWGR